MANLACAAGQMIIIEYVGGCAISAVIAMLCVSLWLRRIIGVVLIDFSAIKCLSLMFRIDPREATESGVGINEEMDDCPAVLIEFDLADIPELSEGRTGGETNGEDDGGGGDNAGDWCSGEAEAVYLESPGV